jgi:hypothetical protein
LRESAKIAGVTASNRRWRKIIKVAAAKSLLERESLDQLHLIVAEDILWNEIDEIKAVKKVVRASVDPLSNTIFNIVALWEAYQNDFESHDLRTSDMASVQSMLEKADLIQGEIDSVKDQARNGNAETIKSIEVELTVLRKMVRRGR